MIFWAASRSDLATAYKSSSEPHRLDQAGRIRHPLAGDVERGAVIDRRADDRQPEGDVDRAPECEQLYRNEPLVVVARDDDVEVAARGPRENGVPRPRAGDIDVALSRSLYRRPE